MCLFYHGYKVLALKVTSYSLTVVLSEHQPMESWLVDYKAALDRSLCKAEVIPSAQTTTIYSSLNVFMVGSGSLADRGKKRVKRHFFAHSCPARAHGTEEDL